MARKVTVPVDMSSEQKSILGILSKRQLIYLIVGGLLLYFYVPKVFQIFNDPVLGFIFALFSAVPTVFLIGLLGFMKHLKHNLYFDKYFIIKMKYHQQLGVWRKGPIIERPDNVPSLNKKRKERK